ncbi:hypothetical protein Cgig2_005892 [Carnegiea gigantea]|uniref:Uncharacterized protein n=1 Tax=Carnegiea gigantea TaxID=171969 RepID=A0A9Q1JPW0_9CARY|nr:hypothetical protein Cgig2_005892 [Carnegiea gigantea]
MELNIDKSIIELTIDKSIDDGTFKEWITSFAASAEETTTVGTSPSLRCMIGPNTLASSRSRRWGGMFFAANWWRFPMTGSFGGPGGNRNFSDFIRSFCMKKSEAKNEIIGNSQDVASMIGSQSTTVVYLAQAANNLSRCLVGDTQSAGVPEPVPQQQPSSASGGEPGGLKRLVTSVPPSRCRRICGQGLSASLLSDCPLSTSAAFVIWAMVD